MSRMLPSEVEVSLAEFVALGLVNSDSFAGLRVLLMPSGRRGGNPTRIPVRRKRRLALFGMADAGRWALVRRPAAASAERKDEAVELIVRTLLRRWGVIFWKLLAREAQLAAAVARNLMLLPPAGGARRNSRRPLCRRFLGRTIRDARSDRICCATCAANRFAELRVAVRRPIR